MSYAVKKSKVNEAGNYTKPGMRKIQSMSAKEYAATTRAKRKGTAEGKQFVPQPKPRFAVKGKD